MRESFTSRTRYDFGHLVFFFFERTAYFQRDGECVHGHVVASRDGRSEVHSSRRSNQSMDVGIGRCHFGIWHHS